MASKKKRKKKNYTILVTLCFFGIIVAISYLFANCFLNVYKIYKEKQELSEKLTKLEKDEEKLSSEVEKLKDKEYIARYAREKYLYSTNGEYIIKLPSEDDTKESENK